MAALYKHIFIKGNIETEKYKGSPGRGKSKIPQRNPKAHSSKLLKEFQYLWKEKEKLKQQRTAEKIPTREGTYLSFSSAVDHDLITKSLENIKKGIRLLNVKEELLNEGHKQTRATVYIPKGKEGFFVDKINNYKNPEKNRKSGKSSNESLVNSIEDVSLALLERFWMSNLLLMPDQSPKWCEVWLNVSNKDQHEQINFFIKTLNTIEIEYKPNSIFFPERAVLLIYANRNQLIELMLRSDMLAEFRVGQELAGFWTNEKSIEQQEWVDDLINRLDISDSNIKICILDKGVNNAHVLLHPLLGDKDTLTVNSAWGTFDHHPGTGHGTLMAGIAGYGNLEKQFLSGSLVAITHSLCSVKIMPLDNQEPTPKELWGDITSQGISRAEIANPDIMLLYCMAVTSKVDSERGRPSSWSGALDQLIYGEGENQRLIIVSAGNTKEDDWNDYPAANLTTSIENPAQSWNALTVGAYTDKTQINQEEYKDHLPIAKRGELSPFSATSFNWEKKWPIKPDIVLEGGNLTKAPDGTIIGHKDLELLSTSKSISIKPLSTICATSAATAQASWFAAKIAYQYPNAWPETIRGLIVHSSEWREAMFSQMQVEPGSRKNLTNLLRVFGYGVPDINTALYSKESALTLISQETIQPYAYNDKNQTGTNEVHFYNLPWPKDLLLSLENTPVKLKVTLSYFIEPGVGEVGWKDKYRYPSFGLRFDINNVGEEIDYFRKRINLAAREEGENIINNSGSRRWAIGSNNRSNGSIHSDFWEGTAAELSTCNIIAVYPINGWWKERKHLEKVKTKTRYSLIISLTTPVQEVELYTTVKNIIEIPIEVKT